MAFREVTVIETKEVLRLWRSGVAKKRIAAQLGVDVKTVRGYVKVADKLGLDPAMDLDEATAAVVERLAAANRRPRGRAWELCGAHADFIRSKLEGGVRLSKVRKLLLRQRQVAVSYMTLYRYAVEELGFGCRAPTIPVADCGPGEEVQLDTGWVGWLYDLFGRRQRRFRAWIFTAVRSRHRFVYPVFPETTATAIEACEEAWSYFGGVFKVVIPDNTKTVVNRADPLDAKLALEFLEYAQSRGFVVDPTRVRAPKDKARVERAVQTVADDCFGGEMPVSLEQAREHARRWGLEEYGRRRHSTTQRMPLEHFETEEREALLPAPSEPYDTPLWSDPKVGRDQHAAVAKSLYSLPRQYRGKRLRARADKSLVRFYEGASLVKTHPRMAPGQRSTDPSDFPPEKAAYALRDVGFLARKAKEHGEAVGRFAEKLLEGPLPWTRMRRAYALLGLARRYGSARLEEACALALAADMVDVHRLRKLLEIAAQGPSLGSPARVIPLARYLRPPHQYALPLVKADQAEKGDKA
jgi:transposase